MENVNLQIYNYKYSEKQSKEVENKLECLIKQIPCNSRVFLEFDYKNKTFFGKLKVDFDGKSFFAKAEDIMMTSLTGSLCKKVQKQIMKWKQSRTVEEITGVIALSPSSETEEDIDPHSYNKAI